MSVLIPSTQGGGAFKDPQWHGIYAAKVAVATDPTGKGRVRLLVPQVLGNTHSAWAAPMQPGLQPAAGTLVYCHFLGGNPDLPQYFLGLTSKTLQEITSNTGLVLNPNPYMTGGVITQYAGSNGTVIASTPNADTNPPYASAILLTASGTGGATIQESNDPITVQGSQPYQVTSWVYYPAGGTVSAGMRFQNSGGTDLGAVTTTTTVPAAKWTQISSTITSPGTAATGYAVVGPTVTTAGMQFTAQAIQVIGSIPGSLIAPNTVTIAQLASNIIYAGIINGTTVSAATLIGGTILSYGSQTPRGPYTESFEGTGTGGFTNGSWTATGCTTAFTSTWASDQNYSLQLTTTGTGVFSVVSPSQVCTPSDPVTASVDLNSPSVAYTHLYVAINWYTSGGTFISQTISPVSSITANNSITVTITDNAPAVASGASADAGKFTIQFGDSGSAQPTSSVLYGDNVMVSGNLAFSASPDGGTDSVGNAYPQGIGISGVSGLTNAFTITDPFGNTLASLDSGGNITANSLSTATDLTLAGASLTTTLDGVSQGVVARAFIPYASLPFPSVAFSGSETALYELDYNLIAGRSYMIIQENINATLSGTGRLDIRVHGTLDGTVPSTSSDILMASYVDVDYSDHLNASVPAMTRMFQPGVNQTIRLLVTGQCGNPGSGSAPTAQITSMSSASGLAFSQGQSAIAIIDFGDAVANTGILLGTGTTGAAPKQNYNKTYQCTATYSYYGTNATGGNAGVRRNTNGAMFQGQYSGGSADGSQFSFARFDNTTLASDISGATINSFSITMHNQHSWYASGMRLMLGTTTRSMPTGSPITAFATNDQIHIMDIWFSEGQKLTFDVTSTTIPGNFQTGNATGLLVGNDSSTDLINYGYFYGGPGNVTITVSYTK